MKNFFSWKSVLAIRRSVLVALLILVCSPASYAQKKEIQSAKDQIKSGKDVDKAQKSMEKLLQDSLNQRNKKIWTVLYDAVRKQYEQGNEKLYLKQKYDTANLFNLTRQLFVIAAQFDSIECLPDKKGRAEQEYRKQHAEYLNLIRPNLYNGGSWYVRHKKYAEAYRFFDQYLACAHLPMFKMYDYKATDKRIPSAAYWAVYCGYKMQNAKATLHHSYEALKDTVHYDYMLQFLAETYKLEHDTVRYVQTLNEGFAHNPTFPFFLPRLVEYYAGQGQLDSAMVVVDKALTRKPKDELYLYTKSSLLLGQAKYRESIALSDSLIAHNDSLSGAYYNAGYAYFNMAVALDKNTLASRKRYKEINGYYKKALPYLERYRQLVPSAQDRWALPLYTIYLNLNKGKEFDEIDKMIKKQK